MQIAGKRIVLTGAASGIGRALVAQLANYDVEIIAADRDATALGESIRLPQDIRASLNPFVCEVANQEGNDQLFAHALATLSGIDIFIASAGTAYYERHHAVRWTHLEDVFGVNVYSPLYATARMAELNPDNPYLTVLTLSTQAHWGLPGYALYGSTRSALDRFADAYRYEMPSNGRLMLVYPGEPQQPDGNDHKLPFPPQDARAIAKAIVRGIESDAQVVHPSLLWRTGQVINRVLPVFKPLVQRFYWRMFQEWEAQQQP